MDESPAQRTSRRTAAGAAAVTMLRDKLDGMDSELAGASAAVAARPGDPSVLHHRAELYLARGRKQEALEDLRSAVALDGRSSSADSAGAQWRCVCRWLVWHAYAALVVLLGATVLISGLLAILSDLRGLAPTPLYSAADRGDLAKVTALLRARHPPGAAAVLGVPLGRQLLGQTPLSVAAKRDYPEVVQALLDAGAEPHAGRTEGPFGWISAETPLYSAAQLGHTAVVRMLLQPRAGRRVDANAGLSAGPFGLLATESPLAVAAAHGHIETVLALLEAAGAQPDLGWSAGHGVGGTSSPLAYAVDRGHDGVIRALLARGARPDLGRTVGPGALRTLQHPCLSGSYMTTSVGAPGLSRCAVGLVYLSTPLYNAARDDLPSAVAALLALPDTDGRDESGRDQSTAQCTWAPAGAGLLSGALMGYCGETASGVASRLGHSQVLELLARAGAVPG